MAPSKTQIDEAIEQGKDEIKADMEMGLVPASVGSFSELHDHVDANEYAGLCDSRSDWDLDQMIAVQDGLDEWLKAGGVLA